MELMNLGGNNVQVQTPIKTCLFFPYKGGIRDTWSFFARTVPEDYRTSCLSFIGGWGGNALVALLSNGDPRAPVSFWQDKWGGTPDLSQLAILMVKAQEIQKAGGAFFPCFFCDDSDSAHIRNASLEEHRRAFGLLITLLRPYVPGFIIGLESSEYFNKARHDQFYRLIKEFAPDRYVGVHMQSIPDDGMPECEFWCYEASWDPGEGDEHSPEELVAECRVAAIKSHKIIWPLEYNLDPLSAHMRRQSQAVLAAGFVGCGGPV